MLHLCYNAFVEVKFMIVSYDDYGYKFIKYPMFLERDEFSDLSVKAKFLYMKLLALASLSVKNGWKNSEGGVYVYCSNEKTCKILNCSEGEAEMRLMELEAHSLIKRDFDSQTQDRIIPYLVL